MPECQSCGEEVDELISIKIDGKRRKLCEDCAEEAEADGMIAAESESVIQNMMEYKGR